MRTTKHISVTPLLHIGTNAPFPHVYTTNIVYAVSLMHERQTVLVPDALTAKAVLAHFVSMDEAIQTVDHATKGAVVLDDELLFDYVED